MTYQTSQNGPYTIIALTGEVDLSYSPMARRQILDHLGQKQNVLVDLSKVAYIDSSGVASLVEGLQYAKSNDLTFGLVGTSKSAMQVLKLARLDKVFTLYDSINDAPK